MAIKCLQISQFWGVRARSQNKLKLKTHCERFQCPCKDTAWNISGEDKKHCSASLQNESVSPSPQEINQSAIKIYFQLLEFTSSLGDVAHTNLQLRVVLAEPEAAPSGFKALIPALCAPARWEQGFHTEITRVGEGKTQHNPPSELVFTPNQAETS